MFDVAYGISVDGFDDLTLAFALADMGTEDLIVLILFLHQLPVLKCVKMFDTLIKQLFPPSSDQMSVLSHLQCVLRLRYCDGCHNVKTLKSHLQENLSSQSQLFDHVQGLFTTKVDVTATTIDKGISVLLTNYNSSGKWDEKCDMNEEYSFSISC